MKNLFSSYGATALFVLLWSSGAIFSRWGLDHSSAFAILVWRFGLALLALAAIAAYRKRLCVRDSLNWQVAVTGLLLIGGYSVFYFLSLEQGMTPGVLATVLGVQPILTLMFVERRVSLLRIAGLVIALLGLVLVVSQSLINVHLSFSGMAYALLSLGSMTVGAILQKKIQQSPEDVLPLQYLVSLVLCLIFLPFKPYHMEWVVGFVVPWLWLGLIISVVAQLLLYRMIKAGNLVNVTSLFYLVPVITAVMDYIFLGNVMSALSMVGMLTIIIGLVVTFRHAN
ncbi:DMT family transporter [Methylobacillus rhizosphaerae]|nr:DMT family transporter [Methylobacillus rhizosphaerae]